MALFELHHHQKREMQSLAKLFSTHSALQNTSCLHHFHKIGYKFGVLMKEHFQF